jgi:hypothetical protein
MLALTLVHGQVGNAGDVGVVELSDLVITTTGGSAGAIGIEWNLDATSPGAAGLWDVHVRLGGAMVRRLLFSLPPLFRHSLREPTSTLRTAQHLPSMQRSALRPSWGFISRRLALDTSRYVGGPVICSQRSY